MLKAIVFDFDGVLADSEPLHYQAFLRISRGLGIDFSYNDYLEHYIGYDDRDAFRALLADFGKPSADAARLAELVRRKGDAFEAIVNEGVKSFPGVVDFVHLAAAALPVAIASGATRRDIDLILRALGLGKRFPIIVSADMVEKSKPDPQTYALAVERLAQKHPALAPRDCLAIEDTAAGLQSAKSAGLRTLGVTTNTNAATLKHADRVLSSLEGLTVEQLRKWYP